MLPLIYPSPLTRAAAPLADAKAQVLLHSDPPRSNGADDATPDLPTLVEPVPGCVGPSRPVADSPLRHLIIGSPDDVRHAIDRLHLLQYVERRYWTPLIAIGAQGIHITPAHGQVLSYLVRQRPIR